MQLNQMQESYMYVGKEELLRSRDDIVNDIIYIYSCRACLLQQRVIETLQNANSTVPLPQF